MKPIERFRWVAAADLWNMCAPGHRYKFFPTTYKMVNYEDWYKPFERLPEAVQALVLQTLITRGEI